MKDYNFKSMGKLLIIGGLVLVVIGVIFVMLPKAPNIPGDVTVKRENFTFYFPLGTSILISIILTLLFYLFSRFR